MKKKENPEDKKRGKCIERLAFTNPVWVVPPVRIWDNIVYGPIENVGLTAGN